MGYGKGKGKGKGGRDRRDNWNSGWNDRSRGGDSWNDWSSRGDSWNDRNWSSDGEEWKNRTWTSDGDRGRDQPPPAPPPGVFSDPPSGSARSRGGAAPPSSSGLVLSGCRDDVVGPIIRGTYVLHSENHDRPVYKKVEDTYGLEGQLLDVMVYFWDDTDPAFCGWWFGPKVGGDQVWAYHGDRSAHMPPEVDWKVPFDGPPDTTIVLARTQSPPAGAPTSDSGKSRDDKSHAQQRAPEAKEAPAAQVTAVALIPVPQGDNAKAVTDWGKVDVPPPPHERSAPVSVPAHRKEDDAKRRVEQKAVLEVRKVVQKVKLAKPDQFKELAAQLQEVLAKSASACGSQEAKVREEADKALAQARKRLGVLEAHQGKASETQGETERKQKERRDALVTLLTSLTALVVKAEEGVESLKASIDSHFGKLKDGLSLDYIDDACDEVQEKGVKANSAYHECAEFIATNKSRLEKVPSQMTQTRAELVDLQKRADAALKLREQLKRTAELKRARAIEHVEEAGAALERKERAAAWMVHHKALFAKYDMDEDGVLCREEVLAYSSNEFDFEPPAEVLEKVLGSPSAGRSTAGVSSEEFRKLNIEIGVAREVARDAVRRVKADERRRQLAKQEAVLQVGVDAVKEKVSKIEEQAKKADARVNELSERGDYTSAAEMASAAKETEELLESSKAEHVQVQQAVSDVDVGAGTEELESVLGAERDKLMTRLHRVNAMLCRGAVRSTAFQRRVARRQKVEDEELHSKLVEILRARLAANVRAHHQLFVAIDTNGDGFISEDELVKYLEKYWGDQGSFPKNSVERWFKKLNGEGTEIIEPKDLERLARVCYKVVRPIVMNDKLDASDSESSSLLRLQRDDVLELVGDGPEEDKTTGVTRIKAKALAGGEVGYVTLKGNNDTVFLETGGDLARVTMDVPLTKNFADNEANENIGEKLKPHDVLEVFEYPKKDEASGDMRLKVKVQSDGRVGWATSVTSQGYYFLKVV